MDRLRINASEFKYKESDGHLEEQFINGLNGDGMSAEIIKELTVLHDTNSVTRRQVVAWANKSRQKDSR